MSIRVACPCGRSLALKDSMAGKVIRCPGCQQSVSVPPTASDEASQSSSVELDTNIAEEGLSSLFDDEGFEHLSGPICPACAASMDPGAVLCVQCGFNVQTGSQVAGHGRAEEKTVYGHQALDRAAAEMARDKALQERLKNTGIPAWVWGIILLLLISFAVLGVVTINMVMGETDDAPQVNVLAIACALCFVACWLIALVAGVQILVVAFRDSITQGLLALFVPLYALYYVATHWVETKRPFLINLIAGIVAVFFAGMASLAA